MIKSLFKKKFCLKQALLIRLLFLLTLLLCVSISCVRTYYQYATITIEGKQRTFTFTVVLGFDYNHLIHILNRLERGDKTVNPSELDSHYGRTPLRAVLDSMERNPENVLILDYLLKRGAEPDLFFNPATHPSHFVGNWFIQITGPEEVEPKACAIFLANGAKLGRPNKMGTLTHYISKSYSTSRREQSQNSNTAITPKIQFLIDLCKALLQEKDITKLDAEFIPLVKPLLEPHRPDLIRDLESKVRSSAL